MKCMLQNNSCVLLNPGAVLMLCQHRAAMAKGDFKEVFLWKCCQQGDKNECVQFIEKKKEHRKKRRKRSCFSSWVEQKHWQLKNNLHFLDQISIYLLANRAKKRHSVEFCPVLFFAVAPKDTVWKKNNLHLGWFILWDSPKQAGLFSNSIWFILLCSLQIKAPMDT